MFIPMQVDGRKATTYIFIDYYNVRKKKCELNIIRMTNDLVNYIYNDYKFKGLHQIHHST